LMDLVREAGRRGANLSPNTWDDRDTRNFERMDCDLEGGGKSGGRFFYNMQQNSPNPRQIPRGYSLLSVAPYNYVGFNYPLGIKPPLESASFGFFDAVACQIILSMAPLQFETNHDWEDGALGPNTVAPSDGDQDNFFGKNEIVVSAVSFAKVDFRNFDANGKRVDYPNAGAVALVSVLEPPGGSVGNAVPSNGTLMMVTKRYPTSNRFCAVANPQSGDPGQPALLGDYRDPNHWQRKTLRTTNPPLNLYSGWSDDPTNPDNDEKTTILLDESDVGSQKIRGFIFTGQQKDDTTGCYGSKFAVGDVERILNQQLSNSDLPEKLPNGGMVIVEMWWQHHPFFLGPLFQGFTGNPQNDPVLYVYALFPANAAEPTSTPDDF
jgi:hypothetical protein